MNNPELYQRNNTLQKRDALQCLEEYANKIKWKKSGATIIDIGCGDGGVTTSILKTFLPDTFKALVGCDVSEKMVQFANAHHASDFISFLVFDIMNELPEQFREKYDQAFSFHSLHWIHNQKIAFSNIYDLLARGGDCLLMFMGRIPMFEGYRALARSPRWSYWMKDVERFVSPYHDCQDPEKDIKSMMTTIGFTNVTVTCKQKSFLYSDQKKFKDALKAVLVIKIPLEMQDDFIDDLINLSHNMELFEHHNSNVDGTSNVTIKYDLITVYGQK